MKRFIHLVFFCLISFSAVFINSAWADLQNIPSLTQRVTDTVGLLNTEQKKHLEQILNDLEKAKGSQVAILVVGTTQPEAIAAYSLRAVDAWKLGRKGVDDGVLLLIAQKDRKMRIEVGYGLEGTITDLAAGRIIREYITPEFRRERFYEGILAGTAQIINLIKGEPLPAPTSTQGYVGADPEFIFFILVAASSFLGSFLTPLLGRLITVSILTTGGAGVVWLVSHNIIMALFAALFIGLFTLSATSARSSSYRDGGGYGGGFGGGGGFSGGGGGFGGGGASGGW